MKSQNLFGNRKIFAIIVKKKLATKDSSALKNKNFNYCILISKDHYRKPKLAF
jgi:hypothetical protein